VVIRGNYPGDGETWKSRVLTVTGSKGHAYFLRRGKETEASMIPPIQHVGDAENVRLNSTWKKKTKT
jgi:hypothetical protein